MLIILGERLGGGGLHCRHFFQLWFPKIQLLTKWRRHWVYRRRAGRFKGKEAPLFAPQKRFLWAEVQVGGLQGTKKMVEDVTRAKTLVQREQGRAAGCLPVVVSPSPEMLGSGSRVATRPPDNTNPNLPPPIIQAQERKWLY